MKPYCVPEKTEKYIGYDMIQNHTDIPALPDARLRLLHAFLEASPAAAKSEVYGTVTALLQVGLDIHDRVAPGDDSEEERAMRSRQLKVLAGDYYSSRFYELLAGAGEIGMVAELSRAIADVNRRKMELYLRMQREPQLGLDDYLNEMAGLKARLFEGFDGLLDGPLLPHWNRLLTLVSLHEAAAEELQAAGDRQAYEGLTFRGGSAAGSPEDAEALRERLSRQLRRTAADFEAAVSELPGGIDVQALRLLTERFAASAGGADEAKGEVKE
ncbi:heptaprenyl diphosphate synthase component 1 [Saccharibacillus sp. CPCC 101409]|uniref:heptaprenyl diphosphate synthase component 1 n=1 Tax=Saccharibacillus sp. CPCC 101409 TaxID=3058041 RepID=UPI002673C737|nr:heptaprenyl diphosphate synthase component 1 [Saccharibacillus sp. CPCC 101409]MDO3409601.1 heptaprenyl diphosphate synthase component 1 [Saccharibacillus sp. CPCC 101409]